MSTLASKAATPLQAREATGRLAANKVRKAGLVPVNLYGSGGPSVSLSINTDVLLEIFKNKQKVLKLGMPDQSEEYAIFQQIDWDATLDNILHVDLLRAAKTKPLTLDVPLRLDGVPLGLSQNGTFFQKSWVARININPGEIPDVLVHDISDLGLDSELLASQLKMPAGATLASDPGTVICGVHSAASMAAAAAKVAAEAAAEAEAEAEAEAHAEAKAEAKAEAEAAAAE